jgi:NAD(P)-dependent dehydrogenase (short-subunit alcohol dehydrogenase family)
MQSDKIAVNSIAPAMTETPLFNVLTEDVLARAISAMPHGARDAARPDCRLGGVPDLARRDVSSGNVIILNQGRDVR